jgi:hypothetical protein
MHGSLTGRANSGSSRPQPSSDLVVLSDDIFTIPPEAIEKTRVYMTMFDGEVIYQRYRSLAGMAEAAFGDLLTGANAK